MKEGKRWQEPLTLQKRLGTRLSNRVDELCANSLYAIGPKRSSLAGGELDISYRASGEWLSQQTRDTVEAYSAEMCSCYFDFVPRGGCGEAL